MAISFDTFGSNDLFVNFASNGATFSGIAFNAGDYFVWVINNCTTNPLTSVQVNGVNAVMVHDPSAGGDNIHTLWHAASVPSGTGSIVVTGTVSDATEGILVDWVRVVGADLTTAVYTNDPATNHADPDTCTGTVPAGGAGLVFIGGADSVGNPTTWGGSGVTGQSAFEKSYATGNGGGISGATISGVSGSVTASATGGGGGNGWGFQGAVSIMTMVTFAAASVGGATDDRAFQNGVMSLLFSHA